MSFANIKLGRPIRVSLLQTYKIGYNSQGRTYVWGNRGGATLEILNALFSSYKTAEKRKFFSSVYILGNGLTFVHWYTGFVRCVNYKLCLTYCVQDSSNAFTIVDNIKELVNLCAKQQAYRTALFHDAHDTTPTWHDAHVTKALWLSNALKLV